MSHEKNDSMNENELDELELQDLLKDHEPNETLRARSGGANSDGEDSAASRTIRRAQKRAEARAAKRKKRLAQGLTGAIVIALVIGLGATWMRARNADKIKAELETMEADYASLSSEKDQLSRENEELSMKVYNLEHNLVEIAGNNEYIEGEAAGSDAEAKVLAEKLEAYTLLVQAQSAMISGDRDSAKTTLDKLSEKYNQLDDTAMDAYYTIKEQLEQSNTAE